eukprot:1216471-Rhodomonas_salina.3
MPREPAARQMLRPILPLYRQKKRLCSRRKPGMILPVSGSTMVHLAFHGVTKMLYEHASDSIVHRFQVALRVPGPAMVPGHDSCCRKAEAQSLE